MMHVFRQGIGGWVVKFLMGLLILSFVIWGIADVFHNFGSHNAAQIGHTIISQETFRNLYTERMQQIGRRLGRGLTPDQARALGVDRQILSELFGEAALDETARNLGLAISDKALASKIEKMPDFQGPGGGFNHDYFVQILHSNGFNEASYVANQRKVTLRQQINSAFGGGVVAPKVMRDAIMRYQNEERSIEYVSIGKDQAGTIPDPTPDQVKAYYESSKASFRAPEYRKIAAIVLTPQTLAASIDIPEAELKKTYESEIDHFKTPEKREVDQIVFPNEQEAKAAADRLAAGTTFDAIAEERKLTKSDTSLGLVAKSGILDPAVANAAFSLPAGQVSAPIKGRFGTVLVRVQKIEPAVQQTFEAVAAELRKDVLAKRVQQDVLDLHDKIEDERASGATLAETAAKLKVKVTTLDAVDRSGRKPDGTMVQDIPDRTALLNGAFATQPGVDNETIEIRNQGGFIWYDVLSITPSRERNFDEVKSLAETRWKDAEAAKKVAALADAARVKLDSGETFAQAIFGAKTQTVTQMKRGQTALGFDALQVGRIFETPNGKAGVLEAQDGVGRIVYRVTSAEVPPAATAASVTTDAALSSGLQDDLLVQYVQKVQSDLGVSVNEAAIRSATGADRN